jgi:beta-lactamase regulating signal transducer with metallopeptidase domain
MMIETRVAVALVNATWQGALVTAVAASALRFAGRTNASVRCAVWCAVLAVVAVLPAVDLLAARVVSLPQTIAPTTYAVRAARAAVTTDMLPALAPAAHHARVPSVAPLRAPDPFDALARRATLALDRSGTLLFWLWLAGALCCTLRLVYALVSLAATRRRFAPLGDDVFERLPARFTLAVAASDDVAVPCLVGFFAPTVVVPQPLAAELSTEDLRRIVLHEAAHAQRLDHWTNLFVQCVRALLFFNPVVYYVAGRIALEREIACDDRVIEITGDRVVYAACLSEIARNVSLAGAHAVPGFFGGRAQIVVRIEELLDRAHDGSSQLGRRYVVALVALIALAIGTARFGIPVVAATTSAPARAEAVRRIERTAQRVVAFAAPAAVVHRAPVVAQHPAPQAKTVADAATPSPAPAKAPTKASAPAPEREATRHLHQRARLIAAGDYVAYSPGVTAPVVRAAQGPVTIVTNTESDKAEAAAADGGDRSSGEGDSFLDALAAAGYRGLSVDELIKLRDHGVDGPFIVAMNAFAHRRLSPDELITLRDHGVDERYVTDLAAAGVVAPIDKLITMRDHGVDPHFVDALHRAGYPVSSPDALIRLADHGISADYVVAMNAAFGRLSAEDLVRLADHGVDAAFVARVRNYFANRAPTVDEVIKMRDNGL